MNKLMILAASLVGMAVLAAAGQARCLEGEGGYVTVHFHQTPGVGDFSTHPAVDLSGKNLSADDVKKLRQMIEEANFFDLKSSPPQSPVPPDPIVGYDLTVDMDGRSHTIWVRDSDVSKSLKTMIDWLRAREKPIGGRDPIAGPAKPVRDELPAIRVEFMKSGGIAGLHFPPMTIDSTKLSAQDARKLAQLIAEVRFFDRPQLYPAHGADLFVYTITVEQNGKRHSVSYDDAPAELKLLIDWLSSRSFSEEPVGHTMPL